MYVYIYIYIVYMCAPTVDERGVNCTILALHCFSYKGLCSGGGGLSVKVETIQRRLAWPLRKDDTHKLRNTNVRNHQL